MEINFHRTFKKQYKKLPVKVQNNFNHRLQLLLTDPNNPLLRQHALRGDLEPLWSINITADYRALFYKDEATIMFVEIGTHSQLYS